MGRLANDALLRAGLSEAIIVGDARRGVEVVDELTMLVRGPCDPRSMARALTRADAGEGVAILEPDTVGMRFAGGGPARLRIVPPASFVEALVRGTGSARHVRWLSSVAFEHGGLGTVAKRCRTEEDLYAALGLPYAPPELREGSTRRYARGDRTWRARFKRDWPARSSRSAWAWRSWA